MPNTAYLNAALTAHWLGGIPYEPPAVVYVGLSRTDPADGPMEPAGNAYARVPVLNDEQHWFSAGTVQANAQDIVFPRSTGNWGMMTHMGLWDEPTGGELLTYAELERAGDAVGVAVDWGDILTIPTGYLRVSLL